MSCTRAIRREVREDCLHILSASAQRTVEFVEDEQARLQAVEKMIYLFAGVGQAAPTGCLRGAQSGQDAGVEMRQTSPLPGLYYPHRLPVGTAQMVDGEAFGDHGLAVVIGTRKQQAAWSQRWRPLKQLPHRNVRCEGPRMADPAWRPDMRDAGGNIRLQKR